MKIALVYPAVNKKGGVERYVWELASELAQSSTVTIAAESCDLSLLSERIEMLKVHPLHWPGFAYSFYFARSVYSLLQGGGFDIVHVQGANGFKQDVVTAHSCHKAYFVKSLKSTPRWSKAWFLKLLNPRHYITILIEEIQYRRGNVGKIIAVSELIKKELIDYFSIPEQDIVVVYNGTNCTEFHPDNKNKYRSQIRSKHGISDDDFVILFVANEFKRKGLEYLLRAVDLLSNRAIKLLVVGKGEPKAFEDLSDIMRRSGTAIFAGSSDAIAQYYAASDIFVLPSQYEPFGLVITEAMACGLPVIVSKSIGAAELIENNVNGILLHDCTDPAEIAKAIQRTMVEDFRRALGDLARKRAEKLTWALAAEQTMAVYASVRNHAR